MIVISKVSNFIQSHGISKLQIFIFAFTIGIFIFLLISLTYTGINNTYTTNKEPVTIYANDKETIYSMAGKLDAEGIMQSDRFILYMKTNTDWDVYIKKVYEGYYTIPPKTNLDDLIEILKLDGY